MTLITDSDRNILAQLERDASQPCPTPNCIVCGEEIDEVNRGEDSPEGSICCYCVEDAQQEVEAAYFAEFDAQYAQGECVGCGDQTAPLNEQHRCRFCQADADEAAEVATDATPFDQVEGDGVAAPVSAEVIYTSGIPAYLFA